MSLDVHERMLIEARVANEGPSTLLAYLFWFFLGIVSAHRFYLGRPVSAFLQIASYFILIGFLWLLIDVVLIPGMVRDRQEKIRQRLTINEMHARLGAPLNNQPRIQSTKRAWWEL